jgi:hypothetical protein
MYHVMIEPRSTKSTKKGKKGLGVRSLYPIPYTLNPSPIFVMQNPLPSDIIAAGLPSTSTRVPASETEGQP